MTAKIEIDEAWLIQARQQKVDNWNNYIQALFSKFQPLLPALLTDLKLLVKYDVRINLMPISKMRIKLRGKAKWIASDSCSVESVIRTYKFEEFQSIIGTMDQLLTSELQKLDSNIESARLKRELIVRYHFYLEVNFKSPVIS